MRLAILAFGLFFIATPAQAFVPSAGEVFACALGHKAMVEYTFEGGVIDPGNVPPTPAQRKSCLQMLKGHMDNMPMNGMNFCPPGQNTTKAILQAMETWLKDNPADADYGYMGVLEKLLLKNFPCNKTDYTDYQKRQFEHVKQMWGSAIDRAKTRSVGFFPVVCVPEHLTNADVANAVATSRGLNPGKMDLTGESLEDVLKELYPCPAAPRPSVINHVGLAADKSHPFASFARKRVEATVKWQRQQPKKDNPWHCTDLPTESLVNQVLSFASDNKDSLVHMDDTATLDNISAKLFRCLR